ncbi:MAG: PAS domain S-box protein [Anaerolineae bacterium]|nr:PAS domain S-box protein [Anaerolineae bacterium]
MKSNPVSNNQPRPFVGLRFLQWLVDPRNDTADEIMLARVRGKLTLILTLIIGTLFEAVLLYAESARGHILMPTLIGLVICYILYRRGNYTVGKWLLVAVLWLTAPLAYFGLQQQISVLLVVALVQYPLLALLVAQHVLQRKYAYALFFLTMVFMVVVRISNNPITSSLFSVLIMIFIASLVITFAIVNGVDREARRLAEKDRNEREARYHEITELVSDFVFKLRMMPDGQFITEWTAGTLYKTLGGTEELMPDSVVPLFSIIHPDDMGVIVEQLERIQTDQRINFEVRIQNRQKKPYWLRIYAHGEFDPVTGKLNAVYGAAQDIHQRKTAQQALASSETRLRTIIESNVMGIVLLRETDNVIMLANHNALEMLGYTSEEFIGRPMSLHYLPLHERRRLVKLLKQGDHFQDIEVQAIRKDGSAFWVNIALTRTMMEGAPVIITSFFEITARKQAEEALHRQQMRYETLVNSVDGVVWVANAMTLDVEFMSPQVETLIGYSPERFCSEPTLWLSRIHPDDRERAAATRLEAVQQGRNGFQQEYRLTTADDRIIWIRDIATLIQHGDQWIMSGLSINFTAVKEAQIAEAEQRRLAESLRSSASAISSTLEIDVILDRILEQLQTVIPSDSVDVMLIEGQAARVARSRGYDEHWHSNSGIDQHLFPIYEMSTFQDMMNTGKPLIVGDVPNYPGWTDFDRTNWMQSMLGAPIQLEGSTIGFLNLASDRKHSFTEKHASILQAFADQVAIALRNARLYRKVADHADDLQTQVKQRTSELELERQRIAAILDSTGDGIVYSEDETIRYVNQTLSDLTGYSTEELINQSVLMINKGGEITRGSLNTVIQRLGSEGSWHGETEIQRKDGTTFFASLSVSLIGSSSGPLRAVSTVRDISKEKMLQQQQTNLVAYASHELRTPITNLKTRLYLLRRRPEHLDQHLNVLDEVTERMKRLVEDLLDISRLERGVIPLRTRPLQLNGHLQQIFDVQKPEADRKGITLIYDYPALPVYVQADPERMAQVITNLLTNAINYTLSGGTVRLVVTENLAAQQAIIQVQDTGIGISPEHVSYIFQPFYRVVSHVSGTGLGLSIARQIVDLHDGELTVSSVLGEGSTFTIRLQIAAPPPNGASDVFYNEYQS